MKHILTAALMVVSLSLSSQSQVEDIHFLIPAGVGGGWDITARATGEALVKSGLIRNASFQNMSGGGGSKAINHLINTAPTQQETLLVNSTPIIVRSLTGFVPQSFRDLTPIAATIADYGALVVRTESPYTHWDQVVEAFKSDPDKVKVAGGSIRGSLDHLVVAAAIQNENLDPMKIRYIPYNAGGKAMAGLLSGETELLSTGLGEALKMAKSERIRILAITAEQRVENAPGIPTLKEMNNNTVFANWRGFFGAPGMSDEQVQTYSDLLGRMYRTDAWEEVRARNGWVNHFVPANQFYPFLEEQEKLVGDLMKQLGLL